MSRPPSARVTTWSLRSAADRERWDAWARALLAARHPSLARVEEVSRTEDAGTLVELDPDSVGIAEWVAASTPSVPDKLAVLHAVAAALDALHAGEDGRPGLAHGALGPETVRMDEHGAARLVGFAPWTGEVLDRFHAPELAAGSVPTRSADAFAFGRLVAEVLGGPAVTSAETTSGVVRALRANPETRRRVRLVRALQTMLEAPAEVRPLPLTGWLSAAVEGTAATEVRGDDGGAPTFVEPGPAPRRPSGLAAAAVALAAAIGISAWLSARDTSQTGSEAAAQPTISEALAPPCSARDGIAAADLVNALESKVSAADLDSAARPVSGGRWHTSRVLLTFRAPEGRQLTVLSIRPRVVGPARPPAWRAEAKGRCGGAQPDATMPYALDDGGVSAKIERDPNQFSRFQSNGAFTGSSRPATVAVEATACTGNYSWQIDVRYQLDDEPVTTWRSPAYFTYGMADNTENYLVSSQDELPELREPLDGSACR